jgi:uracil-DNA glycosylase
MTTLSNRLEKNWRHIIRGEFDVGDEFDYVAMEQFLRKERAKGIKDTIYPKDVEIFNALNLTPFEKVNVVIIGQDPYHGPGQAHGLCFSTKGKIPPSLQNIYKEIKAEYGEMPSHGDLTGWAAQGVLLLNATLTVQKRKARSHQGKGWEKFTDAIIRAVNRKREPVVFLLWGRYAQTKRALIGKEHKVLEASHPSPFSVGHCLREGKIHSFRGCGHFKKANAYLTEHGLKPVEWEKILEC